MSKIKLGGDTFGVTFHLWTTTSYSQIKIPHSCKFYLYTKSITVLTNGKHRSTVRNYK